MSGKTVTPPEKLGFSKAADNPVMAKHDKNIAKNRKAFKNVKMF